MTDVARRRAQRSRRLAQLLDAGIRVPGTAWRVGLDPIIGLVPGAGDFVGAALSLYIVLQAARSGVPSPVLLRMVGNLTVDALAGAVPIVGDVFDAVWKANLMNVALLEAYLDDPGGSRRAATRWLVGIAVAGAVALVAGVAAAAYLGVLVLRFVRR